MGFIPDRQAAIRTPLQSPGSSPPARKMWDRDIEVKGHRNELAMCRSNASQNVQRGSS